MEGDVKDAYNVKMKKISWPPKYRWLHDYLLTKPDAVLEHKESWDALLYRLHGKIFALLLRNKTGTLLNLKCEPYLSLDFRGRYPGVLPGWHMNKLHWISLSLKERTPEDVCMELVDISYGLVWQKLPKKLRENGESSGCEERRKSGEEKESEECRGNGQKRGSRKHRKARKSQRAGEREAR